MNSLCKGFFFPKGISLLPKPDGFSSHLFCNNFCWAGWEEKQPPTSAPTTAWAVSAVTQLCPASAMRPCSRSLAWLTSLLCRSLFCTGRDGKQLLLQPVTYCSSGVLLRYSVWDKEPIPRSQALPPYSRPNEALSSVKGCNSGSLDKEPERTSEHVFLVLSDVFKNKTQTAKLFLLMLIACRKMRQLPSDWVTSASVLVPHSHIRPLCWASVEEVTSTCSTSESWGAVDAGLAMSAGDALAPKRSPSLLGAFHSGCGNSTSNFSTFSKCHYLTLSRLKDPGWLCGPSHNWCDHTKPRLRLTHFSCLCSSPNQLDPMSHCLPSAWRQNCSALLWHHSCLWQVQTPSSPPQVSENWGV